MFKSTETVDPVQDGDLSSILDRDLIKYREFTKYSYNKIKKYDSVIQSTLREMNYQLETLDLNSIKAYDRVQIKKIKKKCNEILFWFTKSKELIATICNYASMSIYEEQDVISFKNATQTLRITSIKNLANEHIAGETIDNIQINIMNLGCDTNRNLKIVCSIQNANLGLDISSSVNVSTTIERMETATIELSNIEVPKQQCRAYVTVRIYNENDEIISSQNIKEVFFRKEGN